jgi:hypothetical protein
VGSNEPIPFDRETIEARMRTPFTREYYMRAGIDIVELLAPFLAMEPEVYTPAFDRSRLTDVNADLFPRDEYMHSERFLARRGM